MLTIVRTGVRERTLAQAAKASGVRYIIKLSALDDDDETRNDIRRWHDEGQQAIRDTGIALHCVAARRKLPPVHPRDIVAVAVRALTSDGHEGKAYPLTGPEALSLSEQVRILEDAIGQPLEYVPMMHAREWNPRECPPS